MQQPPLPPSAASCFPTETKPWWSAQVVSHTWGTCYILTGKPAENSVLTSITPWPGRQPLSNSLTHPYLSSKQQHLDINHITITPSLPVLPLKSRLSRGLYTGKKGTSSRWSAHTACFHLSGSKDKTNLNCLAADKYLVQAALACEKWRNWNPKIQSYFFTECIIFTLFSWEKVRVFSVQTVSGSSEKLTESSLLLLPFACSKDCINLFFTVQILHFCML